MLAMDGYSLPSFGDIPVAVNDGHPLISGSCRADMAHAGKRNMRNGDERAVMGERAESCSAYLGGSFGIDVVGDSDCRFRELHRTHVDDVPYEDDSLPLTFNRVESASWSMSWMHCCRNSRYEHGSPLERLHFASIHVVL